MTCERTILQTRKLSFPYADSILRQWRDAGVKDAAGIAELDQAFAAVLKEIWLAPTAELARKRAYNVMDAYAKRFSKAVQCLENGLEDSLAFYAFPKLNARKISSVPTLRKKSTVTLIPAKRRYSYARIQRHKTRNLVRQVSV